METKITKQGMDSLNPEAMLGWRERIGYGIGSIGTSVIFAALTGFLLIYLTNVAFLDIAAVSAIIAVSKVLDGISDLVIGNIIDQTKSRMGKGRVWLLRMCLPFAVSTLLLFWVPASLPSAAKYVYVFILYNLVSTVCYTFMSIAYASMLPLITINRKEQGILSCLQALFLSMGAIFTTSCFVPMLNAFSGSTQTPETQRGFTLTIAVLCGIMVLTSLICVVTTRERVTGSVSGGNKEASAKTSLRTVVRALLSSKYWVVMFFTALGFHLLIQLSVTGLTYYATYVLHDLDAVGWLSVAQLLPGMLVQIAALLLMKKNSKTQLFRIGLLFMAVGNLGIAMTTSFQAGMMVCTIIKGIGMGILPAMLMGMVADTILYTYRRSGVYTAGMGNAGITASQKIGGGLAAALFGLLMKMAGFDPLYDLQHLPQPVTVEQAINLGFAWIPGVGFVILFILFSLSYRLDREMDETAGKPEDNPGTGRT